MTDLRNSLLLQVLGTRYKGLGNAKSRKIRFCTGMTVDNLFNLDTPQRKMTMIRLLTLGLPTVLFCACLFGSVIARSLKAGLHLFSAQGFVLFQGLNKAVQLRPLLANQFQRAGFGIF